MILPGRPHREEHDRRSTGRSSCVIALTLSAILGLASTSLHAQEPQPASSALNAGADAASGAPTLPMLPPLPPANATRIIVDSDAARTFVQLPPNLNGPRGLSLDPRTGILFVGTFDLSPDQTNFVIRLDRRGRVEAQLPFGPLQLLDVTFNPRDRQLYIAVPALSKVQRIPADFRSDTVPEDVVTLPALPGAPGTPMPNGIRFRDSDGALFISDQAQGAVFKLEDPSRPANICPGSSSCAALVVADPRLTTQGLLPVGANGLAFSEDETRLFINNTGENFIFAFDFASRTLKGFAAGTFGPDGLIPGPSGTNTLIAAEFFRNQIVVLDATSGRPLARLGDLRGTNLDRTQEGLIGPANLALTSRGVVVTNLGALPSVMGEFSFLGEILTPTISFVRFPRELQILFAERIQATRRSN